MKDTEQLFESAGETAEYAKQYLKLQLDYFRLETAERVAKVSATLIASAVVALFAILALVMLSLAAGFYLGRQWDSYALAFVAIAGFYALLAVIVLILKERWLTNIILTSVIRSFFK
ncbi:MAG: phage holin family protein [Saprospiraceae bacterium]|jgi:hypothetical protein|nr:phage holin family protein [Lewinellaceae bacterium]